MELAYQAIGVRVRQMRWAQGMTRQTLAERSSQEPSNISHIEQGATKLSLPTLVGIAYFCAVYFLVRRRAFCGILPKSAISAPYKRSRKWNA